MLKNTLKPNYNSWFLTYITHVQTQRYRNDNNMSLSQLVMRKHEI